MSTIDVTIYGIYLFGYVILMVGVGIYHALKIKSSDEYLIARWNVGLIRIVGSTIATACGAAAFIGFVGLGYRQGISGIFFWIVPFVAFTVAFVCIFGRVLRRLQLYTIPDVFALRFGKRAAFIPALIQIFVYSIPTLAIQYIGMGTIFTTFFGLDMTTGIVIGFALISSYTILGGLPTTILTDTFQAIILMIGLFLLLFFGLYYAGGISKILAITPPEYWNPVGKGGFARLLTLALTVGPFYMVWQATWQRIYASKNEHIAVIGVATGSIVAGILLCMSFLIGIIARGYLPLDLRSDLVFTHAISTVFPAAIGGLVVLGLAAALMSGGDSFVMMGSASVVKDIYQQYIRPDAGEQRMLKVSRLSAVVISVMGLIIAFFGKSIIPVYLLVVKASGAGLVFPFLALMFWRRATRAGILTGMAAGVLVTIGWHIAGNPWVMQAVPGYLSALILVVGVSLATSHASDEQVKAAYWEPLE